MPRIRVLISGVLAMVALSGCLLHPSDAESNQHTGVEHGEAIALLRDVAEVVVRVAARRFVDRMLARRLVDDERAALRANGDRVAAAVEHVGAGRGLPVLGKGGRRECEQQAGDGAAQARVECVHGGSPVSWHRAPCAMRTRGR